MRRFSPIIVVHARFRETLGSRLSAYTRLFYTTPSELASVLEQTIAKRSECLGIVGGDAELALVWDRLKPVQRDQPVPCLLPLPWGTDARLVAEDIELEGDAVSVMSRVSKQAFRSAKLLRQAPRQALRVVCSSQPSALLAFTAAFGEAACNGSRASLKRAVIEQLTAPAHTQAEVVVDGRPFAQSIPFALVSTLSSAPQKLKFERLGHDRLTVLWSNRNRATTVAAVRARWSHGWNSDVRVVVARNVCIDHAASYALDGQLYRAKGPAVLAITPGPVVPLVAV